MADPTPDPEPAEGKARRVDNATLLKRVEDVLRVRIDGGQFHDLREFASEKGWGVSDAQLRRYIQKADALLVERQDRNRKQLIARRLAQREALYARAVNAADYRTALAILDSADKLRGLFPEKDMKELAKLVAAQAAELDALKRRLAPDAQPGPATPTPDRAERPQPGAPPGDDAGRTG